MTRAAVKKPTVRLAREQRVDEILAAARDVFCEKGFDATAVAEIAARIQDVVDSVLKNVRIGP